MCAGRSGLRNIVSLIRASPPGVSACKILGISIFSLFAKTRREKYLCLFLDGPRLPLVIAHFESAFFTVEGDAVSFDRHESIERVAHVRAIRILHQSSHRVVDVYVFAKHTAVTMIIVYVFTSGIQAPCDSRSLSCRSESDIETCADTGGNLSHGTFRCVHKPQDRHVRKLRPDLHQATS